MPFNLLSDIESEDFMNLYKKCTAKPYIFLVNDATLTSDNTLRFRKNFLEKIYKLIMIIDDNKLQYVINRKAAKTSAVITRKN